MPELVLIRKITGYYPSNGAREGVLAAMAKIAARLEHAPALFNLKPFYSEWCERGYNSHSLKWLTEWAASGTIPPLGKMRRGLGAAQTELRLWAKGEH